MHEINDVFLNLFSKSMKCKHSKYMKRRTKPVWIWILRYRFRTLEKILENPHFPFSLK